jgi:hypothetical protein
MKHYAAAQANSKFSGLRAPATSFIWTRRSPVSGDLLLSLAALSWSLALLTGLAESSRGRPLTWTERAL